MKLTVQRDALAEAVAWAARALPARPVIPVLAGLLLTAGDDGLTLASFDYDVSARVRIAADVDDPGTALVPGRLLAEITRSLPGLPVEIADDPDGVGLTCGEVAFTLVALPDAEFPSLPELPQLAGTVDGGTLAAAIHQVTPAASKDDSLLMLTGVNMEVEGDTMTLAATDRYRLAMRVLAWNAVPRDGGDKTSLLVPARILADAARMLERGTPVRIMLREARATDGGDAMIGFEAGDRRLTTRLLAGEFIKYRSRFPAEFGCRADVPAAAFADAVRRVALVAEPQTPIRLSFAGGRVRIEAGTMGHARARESLPADYSGDEPGIAFSPHYLLDGLTAAAVLYQGQHEQEEEPDHDARVRLEFSSATKPAVISPAGDDDFRYLVVPQRVTG